MYESALNISEEEVLVMLTIMVIKWYGNWDSESFSPSLSIFKITSVHIQLSLPRILITQINFNYQFNFGYFYHCQLHFQTEDR